MSAPRRTTGPSRRCRPQVDLPALEQRGPASAGRPARSSRRSLEELGRTSRSGPSTRARRPPTAAPAPTTSRPGSFKDVFPRYKTMQGLPRPPPGRLGLPRPAGRARGGEGARLRRQAATSRRYGIAEFNARCRESVAAARRRVRRADRADGLLGRPVDAPTGRWTRATSRASGGRSSRSSTRACWSRTTGSRRTARAAAPGCPTTRSPRATRPSSTRRCTSGSRSPAARRPARRRPARLDDHAVDAVSQHRGRGPPRRRPTSSRAADGAARSWSPSRCSPRCSARSARGAGPQPGPALERLALPAAVRPGRHPGGDAHYVGPGRLRDHRGRHRAGPPGAGVRRRRPRGRPRVRAAGGQPDRARTGTSWPTSRWSAGMFFKDADPALVADLRERGLLFREQPLRAQLPALLALPHRR